MARARHSLAHVVTAVAVAVASVASALASSGPVVLRSGKSIEIRNTMVFTPSNGKAPALQLIAYAGDGVSMSDMYPLSDSVFGELWGISAESYGFARARVDLTSRPVGLIPFNTTVTLFYDRGSDGIWHRDGVNSPPAAKILSEFVLKSGRHFAVVDRRIGASSAIKGKILSLDVECEDCAADIDARTFAGIVYDAWLEYGHKEAAPLKIDGVELCGFAKRRTSAWQFPLVTSINGPRNADGSWSPGKSREAFADMAAAQFKDRTAAGLRMRGAKP